MVHQADIFATIAEILGTTLPEDSGEDSFSFLSLLNGVDKPVRENAVSTSSRGMPTLRQGAWKLILGTGSGGRSPGSDGEPVQLYNIEKDPGETNNHYRDMPDRVSEMRSLMEKLISDGRSNPGPKQVNDVVVIRY